MTVAEHESEFKHITHISYFTLLGELLGVYYENFGENWPCYNSSALQKLGFAMPETCENWLCLVNSCIYYVYQTCEIYQVLPYSKLQGSLKSNE